MFKPWHHHHKSPAKIALWIVFGILAFSAIAALLALVTQALWNAVIPPVIGWKPLEYWQALGLLVLLRLLFGRPPMKRHREHGHPWVRPGFGRDEWRAYGEFWKDEGENAFKSYLERKRAGSAEPPHRPEGE